MKKLLYSLLLLCIAHNAYAGITKMLVLSNKLKKPIQLSIAGAPFETIEAGKSSKQHYFTTDTTNILIQADNIRYPYLLTPSGNKCYLKFTQNLFTKKISLEPQLFIIGNIKKTEIKSLLIGGHRK